MKILHRLALLLAVALLVQGCASRQGQVYQYATINSLLAGVFDGDLSVGELRRQGDLGIGTFNGLDGEMMALDGRYYQIRADGKVYPATDAMLTPFATVTRFQASRTLVLTNVASLHDLEQQLDALLPAKNLFYAFRIEAEVATLKARSVPRQQPPYPTLVEAAKKQSVFDFQQVTGTLVGFRTPDFMQELNVPGYHFHFLTADRQAGGHVLDCALARATIQTAEVNQFLMRLPARGGFQKTDIARNRAAELRQVEKGPAQ